MSLPLPQEPALSPQAYLAWEAEQTEKHDYLNGEVFAMAGASETHVTIAGNVYMALRRHLRGTPCSVFISDMKLHVEQANAYFYLDVFVTCAESDREHSQFKTAPSLIVEVLSPSTSDYDRGDKFAAYRCLPSVHEVLFIHQDQRRVELYRRNAAGVGEAGGWWFNPLDGSATLELASIGLQLPLDVVYEDVRWSGESLPAAAGEQEMSGVQRG